VPVRLRASVTCPCFLWGDGGRGGTERQRRPLPTGAERNALVVNKGKSHQLKTRRSGVEILLGGMITDGGSVVAVVVIVWMWLGWFIFCCIL